MSEAYDIVDQGKPLPRGGKVVGTIDLTPTWRSMVPLMLAAIENGTPTGRTLAMEELNRMADLADAYVKVQS